MSINVFEAIEKLKKGTYDILLLDIPMPELDGHATAHIIRQELKYVIPIIALTAAASKSDEDTCYASGMNAFLPKPVNFQQLKDAILRWPNRM